MVRLAFLLSFMFILPLHGGVQGLLAGYGVPVGVSGPQLVQQKTGTAATGNSLTITLDTIPTEGNVVIVCLSYNETLGNSISSVEGSDGHSPFSPRAGNEGSAISNEIYSKLVSGMSSDITITQTGITRLTANISEWSGLVTDVQDDSNANSNAASSTVTTNSITSITANNLVIAVGSWVTNSYSSGPTNSFTRLTTAGGGSVWQETAYLSQTTITSQSTGWGLTTGISWTASIAVFPGN